MATPNDLAYIATHPLLTPADRRSILTLLGGPRLSPRTPLTSVQGVRIQRSVTDSGPRCIYRVHGSGDVGAPAEVAFEALSNLSLIPSWDALFKGARYLEFARDDNEAAGAAAEAGLIHLVYGLPGVSRLVHDRDFLLRAVRLFLPSGVCVLCCRSVNGAGGGAGGNGGASDASDADGGPKPGPCMVRGWMWSSGYVVVPSDPAACSVHVSLRVDPKGWIPSAVVNLSLEAIPLNIARLRGALARLPAGLAARLAELNLDQSRRAKPVARAAGGGGAGGRAVEAAAAAGSSSSSGEAVGKSGARARGGGGSSSSGDEAAGGRGDGDGNGGFEGEEEEEVQAGDWRATAVKRPRLVL